ncbi:MAG: peptidoglycan DD-metalloendopeptidase family protein [Spirochaetia bacterium]|nr:peptidoglycan DD-metalloendopeptidase family protein [Spirochaetia bacterium]
MIRALLKRAAPALLILLVPAVLCGVVIKEETSDYREKLDKTKKELTEIKTRIKQNREAINKEKKQEKNASRLLNKIELNISLTGKELRVFTNNLGVLQEGIDDLNRRIASAENERVSREKTVMQILRRQYKERGNVYLNLLFKSGSTSDFVKRYKFIKILSRKNAETVDEYARLIEKMKADQEILLDYKSELDSIKTEKELEWKRYKDEKWQKRLVLQDIRRDIKQRTAVIRGLEESARKLGALLDSMESTAELSEKEATAAFNSSKGRFPWPVDGGKVLARFGKFKHPQFGSIVENRGIHLGGRYGAPVYSVFGGVVKYADWFEGYGNMVIVYHGGGYFSIYGYLSDIDVKKGQTVKVRQVLGSLGDTESMYGNELYFELRKKTVPVNPLLYLRKR